MSVTEDVFAASSPWFSHKTYFIDVPGVSGAEALDVVSFELHEALGEPYRITVELTHPDVLLRSDYVGRNTTFRIALPDGAPRAWHGAITHFAHLSRSADQSTYRFVIEPHVARLRMTQACRTFQRQNAPDMIQALLRHHGLLGHQFAFKLRRTYPVHDFHLQYRCSDWDYLRLLMQQEGMYSYFTQNEHGDVLVFGDDVDHYLYQPTLTLPYRQAAGLNAAEEAILTLETHARSVPQSFRVADYHPDHAHERLQGEANRAYNDRTTYGQSYVYGTAHTDADQAQWEAQLRHEAALAEQVTYRGSSTSPALCPARIVRTDEALPDAPHGMVITQVIHSGARDRAYTNTFRAMPSDRRFRLPLNEAAWPKVTGTLSARVTSPGNYPYAFLTEEGRYVVRLDLDFHPWNPGGECVPLRLAKPFAGQGKTGMHFPALDGDEAVIECRDGDPNKPYIAAFHHNSTAPDLISNQRGLMSVNLIRTQSDNKLTMQDSHGKEYVQFSTPHSGITQLTMGNLVSDAWADGRHPQRGEGFELRTSGAGAVRAKGLLFTTEDQPRAQGPQLEAQAAQRLLEEALQLSASLAETAKAAQTAAADYERQKALLDTLLHRLTQGGLLASATSGMGLVSGTDLQVTAHKNVMTTAGGDASVSVLKRFTVAAGECIAFFVQKLGFKVAAAHGDVEMQAHNGAITLKANQDVGIASTHGATTFAAVKELILICGGSYLRLSSTGIEIGTRGDYVCKADAFHRMGPASLPTEPYLRDALPARPLWLNTAASPASRSTVPAGMPYRLLADGAEVKQGVTDTTGLIPVDHQAYIRGYTLQLANGVAYRIPVQDAYRNDAANGELANQGFHFHESQPDSGDAAEDRAIYRRTYRDLLNPGTESAE